MIPIFSSIQHNNFFDFYCEMRGFDSGNLNVQKIIPTLHLELLVHNRANREQLLYISICQNMLSSDSDNLAAIKLN